MIILTSMGKLGRLAVPRTPYSALVHVGHIDASGMYLSKWLSFEFGEIVPYVVDHLLDLISSRLIG